jgi:hypothetical protein
MLFLSRTSPITRLLDAGTSNANVDFKNSAEAEVPRQHFAECLAVVHEIGDATGGRRMSSAADQRSSSKCHAIAYFLHRMPQQATSQQMEDREDQRSLSMGKSFPAGLVVSRKSLCKAPGPRWVARLGKESGGIASRIRHNCDRSARLRQNQQPRPVPQVRVTSG